MQNKITLSQAAFNGDVENCLAILMSNPAQLYQLESIPEKNLPEFVQNQSLTPLMWAVVGAQNLEVVQLLIEAIQKSDDPEKLKKKTAAGQTIMHIVFALASQDRPSLVAICQKLMVSDPELMQVADNAKAIPIQIKEYRPDTLPINYGATLLPQTFGHLNPVKCFHTPTRMLKLEASAADKEFWWHGMYKLLKAENVSAHNIRHKSGGACVIFTEQLPGLKQFQDYSTEYYLVWLKEQEPQLYYVDGWAKEDKDKKIIQLENFKNMKKIRELYEVYKADGYVALTHEQVKEHIEQWVEHKRPLELCNDKVMMNNFRSLYALHCSLLEQANNPMSSLHEREYASQQAKQLLNEVRYSIGVCTLGYATKLQQIVMAYLEPRSINELLYKYSLEIVDNASRIYGNSYVHTAAKYRFVSALCFGLVATNGLEHPKDSEIEQYTQLIVKQFRYHFQFNKVVDYLLRKIRLMAKVRKYTDNPTIDNSVPALNDHASILLVAKLAEMLEDQSMQVLVANYHDDFTDDQIKENIFNSSWFVQGVHFRKLNWQYICAAIEKLLLEQNFFVAHSKKQPFPIVFQYNGFEVHGFTDIDIIYAFKSTAMPITNYMGLLKQWLDQRKDVKDSDKELSVDTILRQLILDAADDKNHTDAVEKVKQLVSMARAFNPNFKLDFNSEIIHDNYQVAKQDVNQLVGFAKKFNPIWPSLGDGSANSASVPRPVCYQPEEISVDHHFRNKCSLMKAIEAGNLKLLTYLLDAGAAVTNGLLHFCILHKDVIDKRNYGAIFEKLLSASASIMNDIWMDRSALMLAVEQCDLDSVSLLIKYGANINKANHYRWGVLHALVATSKALTEETKATGQLAANLYAIIDLLTQATRIEQLDVFQGSQIKHRHQNGQEEYTRTLARLFFSFSFNATSAQWQWVKIDNKNRNKINDFTQYLLSRFANHFIKNGNSEKLSKLLSEMGFVPFVGKALDQRAAKHRVAEYDLESLQQQFDERQRGRDAERAEILNQLKQHSQQLAALNELQHLLNGYCVTGYAVQPEQALIVSLVNMLIGLADIHKNGGGQLPYYSYLAKHNQQPPRDNWVRVDNILRLAEVSAEEEFTEMAVMKILKTLDRHYHLRIDNVVLHNGEIVMHFNNTPNKTDTLPILMESGNCLMLQPALSYFHGRQSLLTAKILELVMLHTNLLELFFEQYCQMATGKELIDLKVPELRQLIEESLTKIYACNTFAKLMDCLLPKLANNDAIALLMQKLISYLQQHDDSEPDIPGGPTECMLRFRRSCANSLEEAIHKVLFDKISRLKDSTQDDSLNQMEALIYNLQQHITEKSIELTKQNESIVASEAAISLRKDELLRMTVAKQEQIAKLDEQIGKRQSTVQTNSAEYKSKQEHFVSANQQVAKVEQQQIINMQQASELAQQKEVLATEVEQVTQQINLLQQNLDGLQDQKNRLLQEKQRLQEDKDAAEQNKKLMEEIKSFIVKIKEMATSDARLYNNREQISQKMAELRDETDKLVKLKDYLVGEVHLQELSSYSLTKLSVLSKTAQADPVFHDYVNRSFAIIQEIFSPALRGVYKEGEYSFDIRGFDINWSECRQQLHQYLRDKLSIYGLKFSLEPGQKLIVDEMTGGMADLPEPLVVLIAEKMYAKFRPDLFASQDGEIRWQLLDAKEHQAQEIKKCLNALDLTLETILPYFIHRVNIVAGNHVHVDADILLPGIDLTIIAHQNIYLKEQCKIVTKGTDASHFSYDRARAGDDAEYMSRDHQQFRGRDGEHGLFGLAGAPGGHIYLSALGEISNLDSLICDSSGGRGANGQAGGDGGQGKDGETTPPARADAVGARIGNFMGTVFGSEDCRQTIIAEARIPGVGPRQETETSQCVKERSGVGGHGGKGGRGGLGGAAGEIKIIDCNSGINLSSSPNYITLCGETGADPAGDAKGGKPGQAGFLGIATANSNDGPKEKCKGLRGAFGGKRHTVRTRHGYFDIPKILAGIPQNMWGIPMVAKSHFTENYSHQYSLMCWRDLPEAANPLRSTDRRSICEEDRSQETYGLASEEHRQQKQARSNKMSEQSYRQNLEKEAQAYANITALAELSADYDAKVLAVGAQLTTITAELETKGLAVSEVNNAIDQALNQKNTLQTNLDNYQQQIAQIEQNQLANQQQIQQTAQALLSSLAVLQTTGKAASDALLELQKAQKLLTAVLNAKRQYELILNQRKNALEHAQLQSETLQHELISSRLMLEQTLAVLADELRALKQRYANTSKENSELHREIAGLQTAVTEIQAVAKIHSQHQLQSQLTVETTLANPTTELAEKLWQKSESSDVLSEKDNNIEIHSDALALHLCEQLKNYDANQNQLVASVKNNIHGTAELNPELVRALIAWLAQAECQDEEIVALWEIALLLQAKAIDKSLLTSLHLQISQSSMRWLWAKITGQLTAEQRGSLSLLVQATLVPTTQTVGTDYKQQLQYGLSFYRHLLAKFKEETYDFDDMRLLLEYMPSVFVRNNTDDKHNNFVDLLKSLNLYSEDGTEDLAQQLLTICDETVLTSEQLALENLWQIVLYEPVPTDGTQDYQIYRFFVRVFMRECGQYLAEALERGKAEQDKLAKFLACLEKIGKALLKLKDLALIDDEKIDQVLGESMAQVVELTACDRIEIIKKMEISNPDESKNKLTSLMVNHFSRGLSLCTMAYDDAMNVLRSLQSYDCASQCMQASVNQFLATLKLELKAHNQLIQDFMKKLLASFSTIASICSSSLVLKLMQRVRQLAESAKNIEAAAEDTTKLEQCRKDLASYLAEEIRSGLQLGVNNNVNDVVELLKNVQSNGNVQPEVLAKMLMQLNLMIELNLVTVDKEALATELNKLKTRPKLTQAMHASIILLDEYLNSYYLEQIEARVIALQDQLRNYQTDMNDLDDLVANYKSFYQADGENQDLVKAKHRFVEYCLIMAKIYQIDNLGSIKSISKLICEINIKALPKVQVLLRNYDAASIGEGVASIKSGIQSIIGIIEKIAAGINVSDNVINNVELNKMIELAIECCRLMVAPIAEGGEQEQEQAVEMSGFLHELYNKALLISDYLYAKNLQLLDKDQLAPDQKKLFNNLHKLEFSLKTFCHKPNLFQGYNFLLATVHDQFYQSQSLTTAAKDNSSLTANHPLVAMNQFYQNLVAQMPAIKQSFSQFSFLTAKNASRKNLFDDILALMPDDKAKAQVQQMSEEKIQQLSSLLTTTPAIVWVEPLTAEACLEFYASAYQYLLTPNVELSISKLIELVSRLQQTRQHLPDSVYYAQLAVLLNGTLLKKMNLEGSLAGKLAQIDSIAILNPDRVLAITHAIALQEQRSPGVKQVRIMDENIFKGIDADLASLFAKISTAKLSAIDKEQLLLCLKILELKSDKAAHLQQLLNYTDAYELTSVKTLELKKQSIRSGQLESLHCLEALLQVKSDYLRARVQHLFASAPTVCSHLELMLDNITNYLLTTEKINKFTAYLGLYEKIYLGLTHYESVSMIDDNTFSCADVFKVEDFNKPEDQAAIIMLSLSHLEKTYYQGIISFSKQNCLSFAQPFANYLLQLKSQYWGNLCQKWFAHPFYTMRDMLATADAENLKAKHLDDWITNLMFTDRIHELTKVYEKLTDVINDTLITDVDSLAKIKTNLADIYACKRNLICGYSLANTDLHESTWLQLVAEVDQVIDKQKITVNEATKLLGLAINFDMTEQFIHQLRQPDAKHPLPSAILATLLALASQYESTQAIDASTSFIKLQDPAFLSTSGTELLERIVAAYAQANRDNYVLSLKKLDNIVEQIIQLNLYESQDLFKIFVNQPLLIWPSIFSRILLVKQLSIKHNESPKLIDMLLSVKERVPKSTFDDFIKLLSQGLRSADKKFIIRFVRKLTENVSQLSSELLHRLHNQDQSQWLRLIDTIVIDKQPNDINKLLQLMGQSDINNDPLMQKLLEPSEENSLCLLASLHCRIEDRYQYYKDFDEHRLEEALAEFRTKNQPLLSQQVKSEEEFNKQMVELLALIKRAVQLREKVTFHPNQLVALISFIDSIRHGRSLIANIDTGQGKSLITRVMAIVHALRGEKVDVVSSGKHLAERDAENAKNLCEFFGIKVSNNCDDQCISSELTREERYTENEIIYGDADSFQMDYLLSQYLGRSVRKNQSDRIIVDEVDSALLDNMDKVLYISHTVHDLHNIAEIYYEIWRLIHKADYVRGGNWNIQKVVEAIKQLAGLAPSQDAKLAATEATLAVPAHLQKFVLRRLRMWVENAYTAKFMNNNEQYSEMQKGQYAHKVMINDTNTGVEQVNSQWSNGLHQFLQIKHLKAVSDESLRAVFVSNKTYFSMYSKSGKLQGLSGTVGSAVERKLQEEIYDVEFASIPRHISRDHRLKNGKVLGTEEKWYNAIIKEISKVTASVDSKSRPVLVIFQYKSQVEELLKRIKKQCPELLENLIQYTSHIDKQVDTDKKVLKAGEIMLATNIAGRGTDLKLAEEVQSNGGLHVIKTYIPDKSRTDLQVDGRSSRQDMPGSSRYIVCDSRAIAMPSLSVKALLEERDELERIACAQIRDDKVPQLDLEDSLMHRYAALRTEVNKLLAQKCQGGLIEIQLAALQNAWSYWFDKHAQVIKKVNTFGRDQIMAMFEVFRAKVIDKLTRNADMLVKSPSELMSMAKYYMGHKNYSRAVHYFQQVIDKDPEHSGFAYYYWAQAVMESGSSNDHKAHFIQLCKKAKLAFEAANARLQSQNIAAEEVAKSMRLTGKGQSIDMLTKTNTEEMGMYLRHIDAIEKMIGKKLTLSAFQNGEAIDDECKTIYLNIADKMNGQIKYFRFSNKLKVVKDAITGDEKIIIQRPSLKRTPQAEDRKAQERELNLPSRYFYCHEQFVKYVHQFVGTDVEKRDYRQRQLCLLSKQANQLDHDANDQQRALGDFIFTRERMLKLIESCLQKGPSPKFSDEAWAKITKAKSQIRRKSGVNKLIENIPLSQLELDAVSLQKLKAMLCEGEQETLLLNIESLQEKGVVISLEQFANLRQYMKIYGCWHFDLFGLPIQLAENEQHYLRILAETLEKCEQGIDVNTLDLPHTSEQAVEELLGAMIVQGAVREPKVIVPKIATSKSEVERSLNNIKAKISQQLPEVLGQELYDKFNAPENNRVSNLVDSIGRALESTLGIIQTIDRIEIKTTDIKLFYEKGQIPPVLLPYIQQNLAELLSLVEKPPEKKRNSFAALLCMVAGVVQIIVGALITVYCPALGKFGQALMQQGVGDIVFGLQSYLSGNFSWDAYWKYKKQSLMMMAVTLGVQAGFSETGLAISGSQTVPVSTLVFSTLKSAAVNLAANLATTYMFSDIEEKIAELLSNEIAKCFDNFSQGEIGNMQTTIAQMYRIMGINDADAAMIQLLSQQKLNQFVSEKISPLALNIAKEAAASMSATKSAASNNNDVSAIIKVAEFISNWIKVPEYLNKIETIKRNSRTKLNEIKAELNSKVASLQQRGHQAKDIDEEMLNLKAKDAAEQFMRRLADMVKEKVREILFNAGQDVINFAIDGKRKEVIGYVNNALDQYFGIVDKFTNTAEAENLETEQKQSQHKDRSPNTVDVESLEDLLASENNDNEKILVYTAEGKQSLAQLKVLLDVKECYVIRHNSQYYLMVESVTQSQKLEDMPTKPESVQGAHVQLGKNNVAGDSDKSQGEAKSKYVKMKPLAANATKKKYFTNKQGKLAKPKDPKSGKFVHKKWDTNDQGIKKFDKKADLKFSNTLFVGNLLEGQGYNMLGDNSKHHIGWKPYAYYDVEVASALNKDGATAGINAQFHSGYNVLKFNSDYAVFDVNVLATDVSTDLQLGLQRNLKPLLLNPGLGLMASVLSVNAETAYKECVLGWCVSAKLQGQVNALSVGIKGDLKFEPYKRGYAVTAEFGRGFGAAGALVKAGLTVTPEEGRDIKISANPYADMQKQIRHEQQQIIRNKLGEQQYRQQVELYGKAALSQRFFGATGVYGSTEAFKQRLKQSEVEQKFKTHPCDVYKGPCFYSGSK